MQSFQLFIRDDRYSVPTLVFVEVATAERARARAEEILLQSPHYLSVEVVRGRQGLFTVGSMDRSANDDDPGREWPPIP